MHCKCLKCLLSKYNDKKHRYKTVKCRALEYEVKALKVRRHLDVSNKLYENYNYSSINKGTYNQTCEGNITNMFLSLVVIMPMHLMILIVG